MIKKPSRLKSRTQKRNKFRKKGIAKTFKKTAENIFDIDEKYIADNLDKDAEKLMKIRINEQITDQYGIRMEKKILAVMLCEYYTREFTPKKAVGVIKQAPNFGKVATMLNVRRNQVMSWYEKREELNMEKEKFVSDGLRYTQIKMVSELMRVTEELSKRDYTKLKIKDLIFVMTEILARVRLLENKSTENIAHSVSHHGVSLIPPVKVKE